MYALVLGPSGPERRLVERTMREAGLEPVPEHAAPAVVVSLEGVPAAILPSGVPLIVVSSRRDIDSFAGAITAGAAAYLVRPLDPAELREAAGRLARWTPSDPGGDKRRRSRRPLLLDADVEAPAGSPRRRVRLVDVSGSGCRLETETKLRKGEEVRLVPRAIEASTEIALGAAVSWCRRQPEGGFVAALRFGGTSALMAARLFGTAEAERRQTLRPSPRRPRMA